MISGLAILLPIAAVTGLALRKERPIGELPESLRANENIVSDTSQTPDSSEDTIPVP